MIGHYSYILKLIILHFHKNSRGWKSTPEVTPMDTNIHVKIIQCDLRSSVRTVSISIVNRDGTFGFGRRNGFNTFLNKESVEKMRYFFSIPKTLFQRASFRNRTVRRRCMKYIYNRWTANILEFSNRFWTFHVPYRSSWNKAVLLVFQLSFTTFNVAVNKIVY